MSKHIVIIGNSAAAVGAAEGIREHDKSAAITMVSEESFHAYERPKMLGILDGRLKEKDLVWRGPDFYKNHGIMLFLETRVEGVSTHRKRLALKGRDPLEFDELIVASGRKEILPSVKGVQKEGVVAVNSLADIKFIQENLPIAHTVLIVGAGPVAQELARIIAAKQTEVKFFGMLDRSLEGVQEVRDNPIIEILGEADVRAVRLTNHKVVGATLVIFSGASGPNMDFLKDTDIHADGGIVVDEVMRTNIPFVWAAGDVCRQKEEEAGRGWEAAYASGRKCGKCLCRI
ncbi:MAG: NAD(P)/FAD-dependent oxidoreductase [Candidatus Velamenicoccus archaeovorus]